MAQMCPPLAFLQAGTHIIVSQEKPSSRYPQVAVEDIGDQGLDNDVSPRPAGGWKPPAQQMQARAAG